MYQFYHWRQEQRKQSICGKKSLKIQSSNEKVQKKKVQKKKDKETNNDLQNTT